MLSAMHPTLRRVLIVFAGLAFLFFAGGSVRQSLGIEFDVESVRAFADGLGPWGPFLFILVVAGRTILWLPSQVVLIAAGLCFGTVVGAIAGGAGLMLSGLLLFLLARYAGRESIEARVGPRLRGLLDFMTRRTGAAAFALACGYPITPLSPLQAAAGLTPMPISNFIPAAFAGGMIRAAVFAYFGDALIDASWSSLATPLLVFGLAVAIPFTFPSGRAWLRDIFVPKPADNSETDSAN
jgi:uncharacterized membrane protein YdjX (TVP38/TMEM64 family)